MPNRASHAEKDRLVTAESSQAAVTSSRLTPTMTKLAATTSDERRTAGAAGGRG